MYSSYGAITQFINALEGGKWNPVLCDVIF